MIILLMLCDIHYCNCSDYYHINHSIIYCSYTSNPVDIIQHYTWRQVAGWQAWDYHRLTASILRNQMNGIPGNITLYTILSSIGSFLRRQRKRNKLSIVLLIGKYTEVLISTGIAIVTKQRKKYKDILEKLPVFQGQKEYNIQGAR